MGDGRTFTHTRFNPLSTSKIPATMLATNNNIMG